MQGNNNNNTKNILDETRIRITDGINEINVLLNKIPESTEREIFILSELGSRICKDLEKHCITLERVLDEII